MSGIVCAIRGGTNSQATISRAVDLAREQALPLFFLYVVNLDFLTHTSSSRVHTISQEMEQMGRFILLSAQDAAAREGVTAQGVIRHGNVRDEIIALCREVDAEYVVLGRPQVHQEVSLFTHDLLSRFITRIEEETGARVIVADGGER